MLDAAIFVLHSKSMLIYELSTENISISSLDAQTEANP